MDIIRMDIIRKCFLRKRSILTYINKYIFCQSSITSKLIRFRLHPSASFFCLIDSLCGTALGTPS